MASAAYYLGSQANEVVGTPSGMIGSVGVLMMHVDHSAANEMEGISPTIISAGKYKAEASPDFPLSDEARAYLQSQVDQYYGMFVNAVADGRGVSSDTVRTDYGEGRCLTATDALKVGMIDRVESLDATVQRLLDARSRAAVSRRPRSAAAAITTLVTNSPTGVAPVELSAAIERANSTDADPTVEVISSPPVVAESQDKEGQMPEDNKPTTTEPVATAQQAPPVPTLPKGDEPVAVAERMSAMEAENRLLQSLLAEHGEALASVKAENAAIKTERLQKRFTDEVRGKSDSNDKPWAGSIEANVSHLMMLAEHFGEDSEAVAFAIQQGRTTAAQIRSGDLYALRGSDRSGGPMSAADEIEKLARERVKDGEAKDLPEALAAVQRERTDLYRRSREEIGLTA
jgi:hypothetical protein